MAIDKPFLALWAKSGDPPHPLLGHMLDTAAVARAVLEREPRRTLSTYARELGLAEDATASFLSAIIGMHDLGKASPAFQRQWPDGQRRAEQAGFVFAFRHAPARMQRAMWVPHGAITEVLVEASLVRRNVPARLARDLGRCLGAHHGFLSADPDVGSARVPAVVGQGLWESSRQDLVDWLLASVGVTELPRVDRLGPATTLGIMALASVCDWIASDEELFPYGRDVSDPEAYWADAIRLAQQALDAIGWHRRQPLAQVAVPFEAVFPFGPNALQSAVASAVQRATQTTDEPFLVLVEAPMGTGKTEAALYAHLALQGALHHRGLYMALPTMATGNGLYPRVREWLERLGRRGEAIDLQLQHGTAWLHPQYRPLRPQQVGDRPSAEGEGPSRDGVADSSGAVRAAEWFSASRRAMLSEYGVGTVDQALLGVLRVRHHFVRLWGLGNRTVVLDEVHAYDTYTSGLIAALLRWLRTLGSSVILMSATLPRSRRQELVKAYAGVERQEEAPYPRVTVATASTVDSMTVAVERRRRLAVRPSPRDVDELASTLLACINDGGCAACVVNTVGRAQRLYAALGKGEPIVHGEQVVGKRLGSLDVYLLHARFPARDRQVREQWLIERFGKQGYRTGQRPRRSIVIGTQVIEQSLDVDFDVMFTDLAPVDLVLQRAGRLHRFDLSSLSRHPGIEAHRPPAHADARLGVIGLDEEPPDVERDGWAAVYDPYVLLMTWWVLRERVSIEVPDDLEHLIEAVYGEGPPPGLPPHLRQMFEDAYRRLVDMVTYQRSRARATAVADPTQLLESVLIDHQLEADRLEDDEDATTQAPLTRYGPPSISAILLHRIGEALYLDREGRQGPVDPTKRPSDEEVRALFERSVRLGHPAVYQVLRHQEPPKGWQAHPLLRRMRLVVLEEGAGQVGPVRLRLDAELGVVYE